MVMNGASPTRSGRLLVISTANPSKAGQVPIGGVAFSVIVPVASIPPLTVDGLIVNEFNRRPFTGFTNTYFAAVLKAVFARTTVSMSKGTAKVVIGNVAAFWPSGIVIDAGTRAACGCPVDNRTTTPPGGAASFNVTLLVEGFPPVTETGLSVNSRMSTSDGGLTVM